MLLLKFKKNVKINISEKKTKIILALMVVIIVNLGMVTE